jgi:hypothetical protein
VGSEENSRIVVDGEREKKRRAARLTKVKAKHMGA